MKKNISNNLILTSILIFLIGFTCFNPLRLDISKSKNNDGESSTPSISDLPRTFWENNGTLLYNGSGLSITTPQICSNGWGGSIVTWAEDRADSNGYDIYVESVGSNGDTYWDVNGTVVCNATNVQSSPQIVSDGYHGAIIAWIDYRSNNNYDIYAQRVFSDGTLLWEANGTLICNATKNQRDLRMISDGFHSAIMVWRDERDDSNYDLYAQLIDYTGDTKWDGNGTAICTDSDRQEWQDLASDGSGGAIITWYDGRNGPANDDIYAQYINRSGAIKWDPAGINICNASADQFNPKICSDGSGGAIITWKDLRSSVSTESDLYAQRINSTGTTLWDDNGTVICNEFEAQFDQNICGDGSGGAIIIWSDLRVDASNNDIYAQRIDSTGTTLWDDNGTAVCSQEDSQQLQDLITDGNGGAIIVWYNDRNGAFDKDIFVQIINSNGDILWEENGTAICNKAGNQSYHNICTDGSGGAIIVWVDEMGTNDDIYCQQLRNDKSPTSNHPGTVLSASMGYETIDWELYDEWTTFYGQYRVWANNTQGNYYVWENWTSWSPGSGLSVEINRTTPGDFNYTIEYHDDYGQYGIPDTVIVTITDAIPTSNHSGSITTTAGGSETINWRLKDDFGGGNYRVWANDSNNDYYLWRNWTAWTSGFVLYIPIDRTAPGIFNYTIEYNDMHGEIGIPNTVYVTITNAVPTAIGDEVLEDVPQNTTETILWTLYDDFAGGQYRVLINAIAGQWAAWTSGVAINYPVDTSTMGIFNYTIQYYDAYGLYGVPNTVSIGVVEPDPDPGNGNGTTTSPIPGPSPFLILIITLITVSYTLNKTIRNKTKKIR